MLMRTLMMLMLMVHTRHHHAGCLLKIEWEAAPEDAHGKKLREALGHRDAKVSTGAQWGMQGGGLGGGFKVQGAIGVRRQ